MLFPTKTYVGMQVEQSMRRSTSAVGARAISVQLHSNHKKYMKNIEKLWIQEVLVINTHDSLPALQLLEQRIYWTTLSLRDVFGDVVFLG